MSEIKLSVIVPVYNTANYLNDCIQSLLDQDFSADEYELIFVNDGSKDNSEEIIKGYSSPIIKYIYQKNQGVSAARNSALDIAKGKYIAFVDSDDFVQAHTLKQIVDIMENNNLELARLSSNEIDEQAHYYKQNIKIDYDISNLYKINGMVIFNIFSRKIILEKNIKFEERLKYAEDFLFALSYKLSFESEIPTLTLNIPTYNYRVRKTSATGNYKTSMGNKKLLVENNFQAAKILSDKIPFLVTDLQIKTAKEDIANRVATSVFLAPTIKGYNCKELVAKLKLENLYPYQISKHWNKNQNSFKVLMIGYCKVLNRYKLFYLFYCKIVRLMYMISSLKTSKKYKSVK